MPQTTGTLQVAGPGRGRHGRARCRTASPTSPRPRRTTCSSPRAIVHAQERMWQMEVWRRISAGRLSELFGASSLDARPIHPDPRLAATPRNGISPRSPPRRARSSMPMPRGQRLARRESRQPRARVRRSPAPSPSRGPCSTRSPGARSRPGTWAGTWTARSSGSSPTRGSVTRRGPTSCSRRASSGRSSSRRRNRALPEIGRLADRGRRDRRRTTPAAHRPPPTRP